MKPILYIWYDTNVPLYLEVFFYLLTLLGCLEWSLESRCEEYRFKVILNFFYDGKANLWQANSLIRETTLTDYHEWRPRTLYGCTRSQLFKGPAQCVWLHLKLVEVSITIIITVVIIIDVLGTLVKGPVKKRNTSNILPSLMSRLSLAGPLVSLKLHRRMVSL